MDYIAFIHKDKDSDYGVSFPDVPGCVTAGDTLEEARIMAQEALEGHLSFLAEDGDTIPVASSLDKLIHHEDYADAIAVMVIRILQGDPVRRINITLPDSILKQIDAAAELAHMKRSAFLAEAGRLRAEEVLTE